MNAEERLAIENSLLRILAAGSFLSSRQIFEDLGDLVSGVLGCDNLALFVPEGPDHERLFALQRAMEPTVLAFGERFESIPEVRRVVYEEGRVFARRDQREGSELERRAAETGGSLSYVAQPLRAREGGEVLGNLCALYRRVGGCDDLDPAKLALVAEVLGAHLAHAAEQARDRRFADLVRAGQDALIASDRAGIVTDATAAAERVFGLPLPEIVGAHADELFAAPRSPPTGPRGSGRRFARFWVGRPGAPARRASPHAGLRTVEVGEQIVGEDPRVERHLVIRDVSDLELAELHAAEGFRRAREVEVQQRTLLDNAPIIIFRLGEDLELLYLNAHAERVLGVPLGEVIGTELRDLYADADGVAAFDEAVARARGGYSHTYEARVRRKDGGPIALRGTLYPLVGEGGRVRGIEGVLVDVTEEREARRRLVQADRLSTLGTLAAGVAHELNNPAAFALIGIDVLDRLLRGTGVAIQEEAVRTQVLDLIGELRGGIRRIVEIAGDLRSFAAPPAAGRERAMVDVNRAVESAITLTRSKVLERADLDLALGDVPFVTMQDGRLTQVVVNLIVNATQAIPRGSKGRVGVATREEAGVVEVEVTDTGTGIPPADLDRIFAPFFTTKGLEAGTGLGLSISREIVERAGGTIAAESPWPPTGEKGSRFTLRLPVGGPRTPVPPSPRQAPPSVRPARPPLRVLVVDDEPALTRVLALELEPHHEVTVAGTADEALATIWHERVDVVLCDFLMPGMTGGALRERVREASPDLAERFVFMTGVGFGRELTELRSSGAPVLEKPFSLTQALREIRRVAEKNPPPAWRLP